MNARPVALADVVDRHDVGVPDSPAAVRASRSKRCAARASSSAKCAASSLIATSRPRSVVMRAHTEAMPPLAT